MQAVRRSAGLGLWHAKLLTFRYIKDFGRLRPMVHQARLSGGHMVFTVDPLIFVRPSALGRRWGLTQDLADQSLRDRGRAPHRFVHKRRGQIHRSVGATLNALIHSGFQILAVERVCPV